MYEPSNYVAAFLLCNTVERAWKALDPIVMVVLMLLGKQCGKRRAYHNYQFTQLYRVGIPGQVQHALQRRESCLFWDGMSSYHPVNINISSTGFAIALE